MGVYECELGSRSIKVLNDLDFLLHPHDCNGMNQELGRGEGCESKSKGSFANFGILNFGFGSDTTISHPIFVSGSSPSSCAYPNRVSMGYPGHTACYQGLELLGI